MSSTSTSVGFPTSELVISLGAIFTVEEHVNQCSVVEINYVVRIDDDTLMGGS